MSGQETIALVSCVKGKTPGPCPAKDLYSSALFSYMREYAEGHADRCFILSANHGLVHPEAIIEAYEHTLKAMSARLRREWAQRVFHQMGEANLLEGGFEVPVASRKDVSTRPGSHVAGLRSGRSASGVRNRQTAGLVEGRDMREMKISAYTRMKCLLDPKSVPSPTSAASRFTRLSKQNTSSGPAWIDMC